MGIQKLFVSTIVTLFLIIFVSQRGGTLSLSLANNYLYSNIVKVGIAQLKADEAEPLCAFDIKMSSTYDTDSFQKFKILKPLIEHVNIGDRRALGLAYLYYWSGHKANARSFVKKYLSTDIKDPIAWFLARNIEQDLTNSTILPDQGYGLPAWWRWGSNFFLSQGWCWIRNNRFDKAATHLLWFSQAAKREMDFDYHDLEKSLGLYTTLKQMCKFNDKGCELLTQHVEPILVDLYSVASQAKSENVRGEAHFSLGVMEFNRNGLTETVFHEYRLALSNVPSSVKYRVHLGSTLTSINQFDEAEQEFNIALGNAISNSEQAIVLGQMGYLNLARKQYIEAARSFEKSIDLDSNDLSYQVGLAQTYIELDRSSDAIKILLAVVQQEPQRAAAWGYLGLAHRYQSDLSNAADALKHSLILDPTNISFRLELAKILVNSDRTSEAIQQYLIILEQDPSNTDAAQELMKLTR